MKALIIYATRYSATALTSQEIAKVLREEGFDVNIVDAKKGKNPGYFGIRGGVQAICS